MLGSGLADAIVARLEARTLPYAKFGAPARSVAGHAGVAHCGVWAGKRVVAFAGRAHLYQGYGPRDVTYLVRAAAGAGAKTIVLTNAAGGLNGEFARGDIMLIRDHINLTGTSPIADDAADPFVNMVDGYAPHLRTLAREHAHDSTLREGVYAGVRGPHYETPAECDMLRRMGADAVGMSTVLETIEARALGLEVLGISLITNVLGSASELSHADVLAASAQSAERVARVIEGVIASL